MKSKKEIAFHPASVINEEANCFQMLYKNRYKETVLYLLKMSLYIFSFRGHIYFISNLFTI